MVSSPTIRTRNRLNMQQAQYDKQVEEIESNKDEHSTESILTHGNHFEKARNEVRAFLLENHSKLLQEAIINIKRKPEFDRVVRNYIQSNKKVVPGMTPEELGQKIWQDLCSLGPLEDVMKSNEYNEIMLNGWNEPWVQEKGNDVRANKKIKFDNKKHLENIVITKILNSCGKAISEAKPIVDARIGDARVSIVGGSISQMKGPIVTIRKFPPLNLTPEGFLNYGTASEEMLEFMKLIVEGDCTIAMGGATGSGKTTTYKMMAGFIPKGQRTIVIEDTAEMRLEQLYPYEEGYHFLSEECRIMGDEDLDITIQHLLEAGMRQKPHRFIIGEVRRAVDLLTAMEAANTGHATWLTMHGRSAKHLFQRMVMSLRRADPSMGSESANSLLADSLDIIMMQKLYKTDKKRRVFEIVEVAGVDDNGKPILNPIFIYNHTIGEFKRVNPISQKLQEVFEYAEIPYERYMPYIEPIENVSKRKGA